MVLRADVLAAAIDAADVAPDRPRLLMSPRGRPLTQARVVELAAGPGPLIVCGRFEGIDQRVIEARGLEEVSIGDFVLSGGEIAAMALIDACVRLLPGVMGKLLRGRRELFRRTAGIPAIYPPAGLRRPADPGHPAVRRPCQGRGLAAGRGRGPDQGPPARSLGRQNRRPKTPKKHDGRVTSRRLCRIRAPNPRNGRINGRPRSPRLFGWGAPPMEISDEPHSRARKRAIRQTVRRQGRFRSSDPAIP